MCVTDHAFDNDQIPHSLKILFRVEFVHLFQEVRIPDHIVLLCRISGIIQQLQDRQFALCFLQFLPGVVVVQTFLKVFSSFLL